MPGHILGPDGRVEVESADRGAGHASGFDLSIIDELGLLPERYRSLVAGMRSATTAKGGKFLSLSIIGDGPFMGEIIARSGEPGLKVHNFRAEGRREPRVDDEAAWAAANPGLGVIIDAATFRAQARRVIATPADAPFFIAHHLNRIVSTAAEPLLHRSEWEEAQDREYPASPWRLRCWIGSWREQIHDGCRRHLGVWAFGGLLGVPVRAEPAGTAAALTALEGATSLPRTRDTCGRSGTRRRSASRSSLNG